MRTNPHTHVYRWLTGAFAGPLLMALLFALTLSVNAAEPGQQGGSKLKVMTYNVYSGTAFAGATTATDLAVFKEKMTDAILEIRASDPAGRAQAVARQIADHSPHLVSLQEVFTASTGPSKDSLTLEFDYLQLLLDALNARGAYYTPLESVTTWNATVPTTFGYLQATWRIVILARADLKPEHFFFTNVDGNRFSSAIPYTLPALNESTDCPSPLTGSLCVMLWPRGWAFADVTYRGKQFRYVNATLESNSNSKNLAQGKELLMGALNTTLPVILAGDLNCDPSDSKRACYLLLGSGLTDAWATVKPSESGFTKELPALTMRSDYVMLRGLFNGESAALVGETPADTTASGLWPSNHAGLVVKLARP